MLFLDAIASQEIPYIQVTYLLTHSLGHRVEINFLVRVPGLSDNPKMSRKVI